MKMVLDAWILCGHEGVVGDPLRMGKLFWLEAILPLGIIAGMLNVMGNAQYYIHRAAYGRPKHIGNDMWDVAMERRDKKIIDNSAPAGN